MPLLFYDLETSGINPQTSRIMQFGGVLVDDDLQIQDTWETLVKLDEDTLPEPEAVLVTGITPQRANEDGVSEREFLKELFGKYLKPDTTIVGFNSIRFDDEFMRYTLWRNLYDPYGWQWQDGRSRWDLLDCLRMMRALRPDGIKWPTVDGVPTNRLELLTKENNIDHGAHDALGDAKATLELARLVREKQEKLYNYLYQTRQKKQVLALISPPKPKPFVYSSGQYSSSNQKTTVAVVIGQHPNNPNAYLVYDLRNDPDEYEGWSSNQIADRVFMPYRERKEKELERFPVKAIQINRAPAVAPLGVLDESAQERINLSVKDVEKNYRKISKAKALVESIHSAWAGDKQRFATASDVDMALYQSFTGDDDRKKMQALHADSLDNLDQYIGGFKDSRLNGIMERYIARNTPEKLSDEMRASWEQYKEQRLVQGLGRSMTFDKFFKRIAQISQRSGNDENVQFLLEELQLYGQGIAPDLGAE